MGDLLRVHMTLWSRSSQGAPPDQSICITWEQKEMQILRPHSLLTQNFGSGARLSVL